jgi:hypothetical protein
MPVYAYPCRKKSRRKMIAVLFGIVGATLIAQSVLHGGWWWLLVWPGISFVALSAGYFGLGSRIFGKRMDGTRTWFPFAVFGPYLLFSRVVWEVLTRVSREDCFNEIAPGLLVGRRPRRAEIPQGIGLLVDMTCEFPGLFCIGEDAQCLCVPTLDALVPDDEAFRWAIEAVVQCSKPVYIFCAQGHGRSATLAAAVLIVRGIAADIETAESLLRRARPGIRLSRSQRSLVRRITAQGSVAGQGD